MGSKIFAILVVLASLVLPAPVAEAAPPLTGGHPCADQPGFTCSMLTVPLDHTGHTPGTLQLQVAAADNVSAPKGVLLFLTGGPGQPGIPFANRMATERLPELAKDYRLVVIDQRGTGEFGAINCPELQAQAGSSDIAAPTPDAVTACAQTLGERAPFYSTDQTVADLDQLRRALGVGKMVVDGVSYGAFTAERYAVARPGNVRKLVLDSVLPHHVAAADSLYLTGLRAQARVLRDACQDPACGFDPADDLAWLVQHRDAADGVRIFDMIVSYEFVDPSYRDATVLNGDGDVVDALHAARLGDETRLDKLLRDMAPGGDDIAEFSSGLHAATLCADLRFPWGNAATPTALRKPMLAAAEGSLSDAATWPYTPQVAANQGFIQTCLPWPAEPASSNPAVPLPNVPTLLVNGDHDLSTPLEWARQEAALAPQGRLVVVPGASHSIQNHELGHVGRDAVISFLES